MECLHVCVPYTCKNMHIYMYTTYRDTHKGEKEKVLSPEVDFE